MAFMTNCTTKGCGKYQEPVLDTKTNEVHCSECGEMIQSISHFTKTQMKALGQVKKSTKSAFSVKCEKCRLENLPKLDKNNQFICNSCNNPLKNISVPFAILIKDAIARGKKDDL